LGHHLKISAWVHSGNSEEKLIRVPTMQYLASEFLPDKLTVVMSANDNMVNLQQPLSACIHPKLVTDSPHTFSKSTLHSRALLLLKSPLLTRLPKLRCTNISSRGTSRHSVSEMRLSEHPIHRMCCLGGECWKDGRRLRETVRMA
jgi:hypothetical protein